jgi:type II secretory pathway component PulF
MKLAAKEQILFAKRLAFLMRSGMPILDCLSLIKKQTTNQAVAKIYQNIISDVSDGRYLSAAIFKAGNVFGDFAVNIIKVGESGGTLHENLAYLAEELKKKQELRKKILAAMFYPAFIVMAASALTLLLSVVIFPKVLPIFSSIGLSLPLSTRVLIFVSNFMINYGLWTLFCITMAAIGLKFYLRRPKYKIVMQKWILKAPIFGKIFKNYFLSSFCRTLGLLLKAHTKLDDAIIITANATENLVYKEKYQNMALFVLRGEKISNFLKLNEQLFPVMLSAMVSVGEVAGNLSETFLYLAEVYESELDDLTKNLSTLLEPVLMIFMGLLVGFVAISIITPIYSITEKLHP